MAGNNALPQGTNLVQSFYGNALQVPNKNEVLYYKQPRYNMITALMDMLNVEEPEQSGNRKIEIYSQGNYDVSATIGSSGRSTATNGRDLVLSFQDSDFQSIRNKDIVRSGSSEALGRVLSTQPGQITIQPWDKDSFDSSDFATDSQVQVMFDASPDENSKGKETLYHDVQNEYNYIGISQDAMFVPRNALGHETWITTESGNWWAFKQEDIMLDRFSKNLEKRRLISPRQYKDGVHTPGGLEWYIDKYGYPYVSNTQATEGDIQEILKNQISEAGSGTEEITILAGINFLSRFQTEVVDKFITYVGKLNTIGGQEIFGINGYEYEYLNVRINVVNYAILDDKEVFGEVSSVTNDRKMKDTAYFIDTTPVPSTAGDIGPFKRKYLTSKPMWYWYVPGSVNPNGMDPTDIQAASYSMSASLEDGFWVTVLTDDGYEFRAPERHAYFKLAS